jgi:hypothetical protein
MRLSASSIYAIAIALSGAACTVNQSEVPPITGPSDFAKSLTVTATPDNLYLNGQQATIIVEARDATGGPLASLRVHLSIVLGGFIADKCGHLSFADVTTGSDGRTATLFTAPVGQPLPECQSLGADGILTIQATPVDSNFQTARAFSTSIRLRPPPPASASGAFTVNFSIVASPTSGEPRKFTFADQGSVSPGHTITSYVWTWTDGATKSGPMVDHDFPGSGNFGVTLTVTDDIGQTSFKPAELTVG